MRCDFIFLKYNFLVYLANFFAIIISLPFHECAHAYIAMLLGDNTALKNGRLTLNLSQHVDIVGIMSLMFLGFGWAKSVPINIRKLNRPKRDMALIGLAGPFSNLLLAMFSLFCFKLFFICSSN